MSTGYANSKPNRKEGIGIVYDAQTPASPVERALRRALVLRRLCRHSIPSRAERPIRLLRTTARGGTKSYSSGLILRLPSGIGLASKVRSGSPPPVALTQVRLALSRKIASTL
jgi:hypothetical protein